MQEIIFEQPFQSISSSIEKADKKRMDLKDSYINFGIPAIDDVCGGLFSNDLLLVTAKSGVGKTELATKMSVSAAMAGRRVAMFALEADKQEITMRIKFKIISELFYRDRKFSDFEKPNYLEWLKGQQEYLLKYEVDANEIIHDNFQTLSVYYRERSFGPEDFIKKFIQEQSVVDFFVLDHFHYFDFNDDNENKSQKLAIQAISDTINHLNVPVVMVTHLRKSLKNVRTLLPSLEDIHGSSDIAKIATKAIGISKASENITDIPEEKLKSQTLIQCLKNRKGGDRTSYVGLVNFDFSKNDYEQEYMIGRLNYEETKWEAVPFNQKPQWAKGAT